MLLSTAVTTALLLVAAPQEDGYAVLKRSCVKCHGGRKTEGGFDVAKILRHKRPETQLFAWRRMRAMLEVDAMPPRRKLTPERRRAALAKLDELEQLALQRGGTAGSEPVRRLTREELAFTLTDLLGVETQTLRVLPPENVAGGGFEASSATLFLHPVFLERTQAIVRLAIRTSLPDRGKAAAALPDPKDAARFLTRFGRRAFRRPLTAAEAKAWLQRYQQARTSSQGHRRALRAVLAEMLIAPSFLLRVEDAKITTKLRPVSDHGLASRLSFFLWSQGPDDELLDLADQGQLRKPEILASQTERMLADPRALRFARSFAAQWLGYRGLGTRFKPDPIDNPAMTDSLMAAMREEVARLVHRLIQKGRPFRDLLDASRSYVTPELAKFYRQKPPRTAGYVQLQRPSRHGLLGKAAILASTSHPDRTSPVRRGAWILERLLGLPPPPPPPGAGEFAEELEERDISLRKKLARHRSRSDCAACHRKIDPLGFALESFDQFGRRRRADDRGELPDGTKFRGPVELRKLLLERHAPDIAKEASRRMLAYALGRPLAWHDERTAHDLAKRLQKGGWRALVHAIVRSRAFRFQAPPEAAK